LIQNSKNQENQKYTTHSYILKCLNSREWRTKKEKETTTTKAKLNRKKLAFFKIKFVFVQDTKNKKARFFKGFRIFSFFAL
jgi:hypothetical protein